ncbi:uncharacterized protein LOC117729780 isoform X1 [Cyclopterus lumpus]|uniref:uncharacterized protein LOC117729780 isoform X1 n=1 Tax=Cyclopterus lumpus TaxID=8103 RepID=UPI001485F49A|nr:uncharacterized protein LOC117729780 isoform X1 [Cyclopterus lumpus]
MVDNIVSKPLGLVLIVTVHMVFNGPIPAEVTGSLGTNITFQFTFNTSVTKHFAVYTTNHTKIAEYSQGNRRKREGDFDVHPENNYVLCHITNLKLHHSGIYWATLFMDLGLPIESNNKVQLIVREENRINTVPPMANDITIIDSGSPSFFSTHIVTVLVVPPVVLLAAVLPLLIWCLMRTKDKQPPHEQHSSNPTVQETVEASNNVPTPPLVYSVLDFPKRSAAVLEINPSGTEYSAVSYLSEKRQV